jgi:hypothetical protein
MEGLLCKILYADDMKDRKCFVASAKLNRAC